VVNNKVWEKFIGSSKQEKFFVIRSVAFWFCIKI